MVLELERAFCAALCMAAAALYSWKAHRFSGALMEKAAGSHRGLLPSIGVSLLLIWAVLFSKLPILILFLLIYLSILLEYLFFFKGRLVTFVFASGTFIFHIMNIHLLFFGLFSMIGETPSMKELRQGNLYPVMVFVVLLVLNVFLELFERLVDKEILQLLIKNISQLYFVTTSLMLINVYLCMLGICYSVGQYFGGLLSLFLLSTSILLFGAFYTAFNHAVRMSILVEYETKSKALERQLVQSNENISQLKSYVYQDPLTGASNRRYGLQKLNRLLEEKRRFCICFADLDHLKYVNDTFGHSEGDKYILCVIQALSRVFGSTEICRMGGDEFMLLIPGAGKRAVEEQLLEVVREMRGTAARMRFSFEPSLSYGVMEVEEETILGALEILDMVDRKMYEQKREKRREREKESRREGAPPVL